MPIANAIVAAEVLRQIGAAGSVNGAAQTKGTATDLQVTILTANDGATAVGGSVALQVQGSNVTSSVSSNWNNVTADKGTIVAGTVSAQSMVLHYAQLQYQYYRLQSVAASTATCDLYVNWSFQNITDSTSNSVA